MISSCAVVTVMFVHGTASPAGDVTATVGMVSFDTGPKSVPKICRLPPYVGTKDVDVTFGAK